MFLILYLIQCFNFILNSIFLILYLIQCFLILYLIQHFNLILVILLASIYLSKILLGRQETKAKIKDSKQKIQDVINLINN